MNYNDFDFYFLDNKFLYNIETNKLNSVYF